MDLSQCRLDLLDLVLSGLDYQKSLCTGFDLILPMVDAGDSVNDVDTGTEFLLHQLSCYYLLILLLTSGQTNHEFVHVYHQAHTTL